MKEARHNRIDNRHKQSGKAVAESQTQEVTSMEEFRAKYLPKDAEKRSAQQMTPEKLGADWARKSLTVARRALAGMNPRT